MTPTLTPGRAIRWPQGVHHLVAEMVARYPRACAVREPLGGRSATYEELWRRAGWMAADLVGHGVRLGDLVGVALDRSVDLVVALLGIVRAGAAYVPFDKHAPADRLAAIVEQAGIRVVVGGRSAATGDPAAVSAQRVPVPTEAPADGTDGPALGVDGEDPMYVAYTSGSTGLPKGVVVPHRAVMRLAVEPNYCVVEPGDPVANLSNPAFDATTFELWSTLTAGGTVVVFPPVTDLTLDEWEAMVREEGIATMFLTTSLFHVIARERPSAFRTLRTLLVGGEQLEIGTARRVLEAEPPRRLVNAYGPTETTTFATYFECTTDTLTGVERVPIGFPIQNTSLYVLDDELRPVPSGDTGELCIGGPGVAKEYLHLAELTARKFVADPWCAPPAQMYRTGDLVRQLPSGALQFLGRRDRQVKLRGFRIELEEIERATVATGLVDVALVEKVGDGPSGVLAGFVLPTGGAVPEGDLAGMLSAELAERLPEFMVPGRWVVLAELPLGPTGKTDRDQLLALLSTANETTSEPQPVVADGEPVVAALQAIWTDVLGVDGADGDDNFIMAGGNSILAVQVASRLNQQFGIEIEPADVLIAYSFADLAEQVGSAAGQDSPAAALAPAARG